MVTNTMATIEPRLMHLLNVNDDQDQLPSIHSTLGASSNEDNAALLLPPLELSSQPEQLSSPAGKQQQQQQQHQVQHQHPHQHQQAHYHQQPGQGHSSLGPAFSPSAADDDPSLASASSGAAAPGWPSRSMRMFLDSGSSNAAASESFGASGGLDDASYMAPSHLIGKRSHVLPHTDDHIQLPQPLKKQKSSQQVGSLSQVFPPIINGLHEPPPNAAVFPPIAYAEYDDEGSLRRRSPTADYGSNAAGAAGGGTLGGGSASSGSHYLFEGMMAGHGASSGFELDRMGDASMLPMGASRHLSNLPILDASPGQDKGKGRATAPAGSVRSGTSERADSPEAGPSSSNVSKPKRRATKPRRRWTEEETNQLLIGVSRHGLGKWTAILEDPEFSFSNRTAGDLKDRFRTCCPEELRGKLHGSEPSGAGSQSDATSPPSYAPGPSSSSSGMNRLKAKTSLSLEDILIETDEQSEPYHDNQGQDNASGSGASPDQAKIRKRRVHRRNMEDMVKLGIQGPFKKSHRRERRPFTEQDDKEILEGLQMYGPAWTKIHRHPDFNLSSRQPTDLRDRVRNKYPEIYANIEKGVYQPQPEANN